MKKLIFLIILLASTICYAQDGDPSIRLGQLKLRYDRDSNALRIELTGPSYGSFRLYKGTGLGLTNLFSVSSDLTWSAGTLGLTNPISRDTLWASKITIYKDTIISENSYSKNWTLKRRFFNQRDSLNVYVHYLNTLYNTQDSFLLINNAMETDNETSVTLSHTGTLVLVDSLTVNAGLYLFNFGMMWERPGPGDPLGVGISDTVEIALKESGSAPNVYIKRFIRDIKTYAEEEHSGSVLSWSAVHRVSSDNTKIYIYGKYLGTALAIALSRSPTVYAKRGFITGTQIR